MNSQELVDNYKKNVLQIKTESGAGSGFYLHDFELIVTNHHVIRGYGTVMIKGMFLPITSTRVLYIDEKYDLAFLEVPEEMVGKLSTIPTGNTDYLKDGDEVIAMGHPYGLDFTTTRGVVSRKEREYNGVNYIQIDAAINPGNSGGPVMQAQSGEIIGVNTFIIRGGDNLGFALPINLLLENLVEYKNFRKAEVVKCPSCRTLVYEGNIDAKKYCPNCGETIKLISNKKSKIEENSIYIEWLGEYILEKGLKASEINPYRLEVQDQGVDMIARFDPMRRKFELHAIFSKIPSQGAQQIFERIARENLAILQFKFGIFKDTIYLSYTTFYMQYQKEHISEIYENLVMLCSSYQKEFLDAAV